MANKPKADEQFQAMGLNAAKAKFVVAKNPMNYRNVYADAARAAYILDTPGPTPASVRHVDFKKLQGPFFPRDTDIAGLRPTILR